MERIQPIADTGFVVALLNRSDAMHSLVTNIHWNINRSGLVINCIAC